MRRIGLAILFARSIASAPLTAEAHPPSRETPRVGVLQASARICSSNRSDKAYANSDGLRAGTRR